MNTVIVGNVPYLNTKPLAAMLYEAGTTPGYDVQVIEAVPSQLAVMLERREVAAALVSSAIPLLNPSLCALQAGAVTSDGPVRSIRLLSRVRPEKITRLALDASSRTSVILCRILLSKVYGVEPDIVSLAPDVPAMLDQADAALVIGDPAMRAWVAIERGELPQVREDLDLGSLWRSVTGLPFVYAAWAAPRDGDLEVLTHILARSAAWGVPRRAAIAEREAPYIGLPADLCRRYVTDNIIYDFGPREWAGMMRFHAEAVALGLMPPREDPMASIYTGTRNPCLASPVEQRGS